MLNIRLWSELLAKFDHYLSAAKNRKKQSVILLSESPIHCGEQKIGGL